MSDDALASERERIRSEYMRRAREIGDDRYAPWQRAEKLLRVTRSRIAAELLHKHGVFPKPEDRCLEIGFGSHGWLTELLDWGVRETALAGIDLDEPRVESTRRALPSADLRSGDATALPWAANTFRIAVTSTVFSSILDDVARTAVARELVRVLEPGGALIFYDFAYDNPKNDQVRKVDRADLTRLFPELRGSIRRVTLAPPLARLVAPLSWTLATALELVPWLRTHLIAVLVKER